MTKEHYVYGLFRPDNGVIFYVGMGRGGRAGQHEKCRKRGRSHKDNIICKLIDDLSYTEIPIVILRDDLSRQEAIDLEIALIYAIGRKPLGPLTNIARGGEGMVDPTPEFRIQQGIRMRKALSDPGIRKKMSAKARIRDRTGEDEIRRRARMGDPDVKRKLSAAKLGKPGAKKGKKYGPSQKGKGAQSKLVWITDGLIETRVDKTLPIPEGWRRGRNLSSVTAAISGAANSKRGKPAWNAGKQMSAEFCQGMSSIANKSWANPEIAAKMVRNRKGRSWITNGESSKTILPSQRIPDGWYLGRKW